MLTGNSGQFLYIPLSFSEQSAFSLTAGRVTGQTFTSPLKLIHLENGQGLDIEFGGKGNENTTFDYKVWCVKCPRVDVADDLPSAASLYQFGSGTCTLGTATGVGTLFADHLAATSETIKMCDTVTFALATWGQYVVDTYQLAAPTAYSPANNTVGCVTLPLLGRVCNAAIIEFDLTGATGANALVSLCD